MFRKFTRLKIQMQSYYRAIHFTAKRGNAIATADLVMAALRSRCGHYIFVLFLSSFFIPRLISAVADWMSTILPHMVWL